MQGTHFLQHLLKNCKNFFPHESDLKKSKYMLQLTSYSFKFFPFLGKFDAGSAMSGCDENCSFKANSVDMSTCCFLR